MEILLTLLAGWFLLKPSTKTTEQEQTGPPAPAPEQMGPPAPVSEQMGPPAPDEQPVAPEKLADLQKVLNNAAKQGTTGTSYGKNEPVSYNHLGKSITVASKVFITNIERDTVSFTAPDTRGNSVVFKSSTDFFYSYVKAFEELLKKGICLVISADYTTSITKSGKVKLYHVYTSTSNKKLNDVTSLSIDVHNALTSQNFVYDGSDGTYTAVNAPLQKQITNGPIISFGNLKRQPFQRPFYTEDNDVVNRDQKLAYKRKGAS